MNFDRLLEEGVIGPEDMHVFAFADSPRQAWDMIQAARCGPLLAEGGDRTGRET